MATVSQAGTLPTCTVPRKLPRRLGRVQYLNFLGPRDHTLGIVDPDVINLPCVTVHFLSPVRRIVEPRAFRMIPAAGPSALFTLLFTNLLCLFPAFPGTDE